MKNKVQCLFCKRCFTLQGMPGHVRYAHNRFMPREKKHLSLNVLEGLEDVSKPLLEGLEDVSKPLLEGLEGSHDQ